MGREIIDLAGLAGLELDPWQAWIMEQAHNVRADRPFFNPYTKRIEYKWCAKEVGVMVSRQNGKGSILEARELAGLFLFGERFIIHSAHLFDTSLEAFERIYTLIDQTPELKRQVKTVSRSHGKEGFVLHNGQRLHFRARTKGGGRGFTADTLVLDESMYLESQTVQALVPTLSARPNAQIWYTGSAGDKESEQFGRVRSRALGDEDDPELFYCEWSIDSCNDFCPQPMYDGQFVCEQHDDPKSHESWAMANPGLGIRISTDHIAMEMRSMSHEGFLQERLGVGNWPVDGNGWTIISKQSWNAREDEGSEITGRIAVSVDVSPDEISCISVAGYNDRGQIQVEVAQTDGEYHHRPGTGWVLPVLKRMWKQHKPYAVVIDKASQAGMFVTELEDAGIKVLSPNTRQFAQSCGEFKSAVAPKRGEKAYLVHLGQPPLDAAVAGASVRQLSDMWAWSKRDSTVDVSPLVSCTLAMWGFKEKAGKSSSVPMIVFA